MKEHAQVYEVMTQQRVDEVEPTPSSLLRELDTTSLELRIFEGRSDEPVVESQQLLRAYGVQGKYDKIAPALLEMEQHAMGMLPVDVYNAAIAGFTYTNAISPQPHVESIATTVERMKLLQVRPNIETFENLALASCRSGNLDDAFELLYDLKEINIKPSHKFWGILIDTCQKEGKFERACATFDLMRTRFCEPNVHIMNTMILIAGKMGEAAKAYGYFEEMLQLHMEVDKYSYHSLLYALSRSRKYEMRAHITYEQMKADNIEMNVVTFGTLLFACTQRGDVERAKIYWNEMKELKIQPNQICYDTMLNVYAKSNLCGAVPEVSEDKFWRINPKFREPRLTWQEYNVLDNLDHDLNDILPTTPESDMTEEDKANQLRMLGGGGWEFPGDPENKGHDIEPGSVREPFDKNNKHLFRNPLTIEELPPPMEAKETLQKRNLQEAMTVFQEMVKKFRPTTSSLNALLNVHSYADRINTAMRCLGLYKMYNIRPDTRTFASLIWMFVRNNQLEKALILKETLPKDVRVTEQMMDELVKGAGKARDVEIGSALLEEMRMRGMRPPGEAKLLPLRRALEEAGIVDPNMPADPWSNNAKIMKYKRTPNFGKTIRKKAIWLNSTGFDKVPMAAYGGYGSGKSHTKLPRMH
jgi:pentatricopeptide repeat protein